MRNILDTFFFLFSSSYFSPHLINIKNLSIYLPCCPTVHKSISTLLLYISQSWVTKKQEFGRGDQEGELQQQLQQLLRLVMFSQVTLNHLGYFCSKLKNSLIFMY